jgi:AcrR family transcriptional regulator
MRGTDERAPVRARAAGRPRKLPFDQREQAVLDAAASAFADRGAAVPMALIAERAGVNKALVYEHFASKEALFAAVVRRARDQMVAHVAERYAAGGARSTRQRVRDRYHAFLDFAALHPDAVRVLGLPEAAVAFDGTGHDVLSSGLATVLADDLRRAGLPANELPGILAAMFVGMAGGVIRRSAEARWDPEAVVDLLTDFTLAGLVGVDRAVLERADTPR